MAISPFVAGYPLLASDMNLIGGFWASYTPTWSSTGTAPVLNNGTLTGRWARCGNVIFYMIKLTIGSTTSLGTGNYTFTLPVAVGSVTDFIGDAFAGDNSVGSAGYSVGRAFLGAGGLVGAYFGNTVGASALTNANPMTWANGDRLWLSGFYEAA
ncbi:hypothetical protein [Streptomyces sp. NBC_01565]|uniref:hypothetical protein n=1 Tax=Streptomyces sp. NBC_01565 TaxID=2975881 RepID=UPI002252262D|nr:hypothetical protein [Streptomyces sp. NBC_01565]MCX4540504.1 hypothetical protein [Streptomyces sp. NBC_01565]